MTEAAPALDDGAQRLPSPSPDPLPSFRPLPVSTRPPAAHSHRCAAATAATGLALAREPAPGHRIRSIPDADTYALRHHY